MPEQDAIILKLAELEAKVDQAAEAARKTYRIIWWTGVISVTVIIIPLLIFPFVLPAFFAAEGVGSVSGF